MDIKVVPDTIVLKKSGIALSIDELIRRYVLSNQAEGKSPKTIDWNREMLNQFPGYLNKQQLPLNISSFNIQVVRDYILYLRNKHKYEGHPHIITQNNLILKRSSI